MDQLQATKSIEQAIFLIEGVNLNLSQKSEKQYQSAFNRMHVVGLTPEKIANTKNGFYFYRAALVHHHASKVRSILHVTGAFEPSKMEDHWIRQAIQLEEHINVLKQYSPDPGGQHLACGDPGKWVIEAKERKDAGGEIATHSKRVRLRGLQIDWRAQMFVGVGTKSKYQASLAVLSATGARPAELELGVEVALEIDGQLVFTVRGVKTHGGKYGQEVRILTVKPATKETWFLVDQVRAAGAPITVTAKAGALSDRIRMLSAKVFPKLKKPISAYVFRHQFAADLKASGMPLTDVSAALGHSVEETKRYYGAAQSARSDGGVTKVQASRPVKEGTLEKVLELGNHHKVERMRDR